MDKTKLEISGKSSPEAVVASYKPIPEQDIEDQAHCRLKSLVKSDAKSEIDGSNEKMLPADDDKVPEVVVFSNDAKSPQNGDAKLDIAEAKQAFVGLTKEELMKYANDPFWVRLRWFLFVSFWLLWLAMLVGAVLIIYAAPKCDPPPPRTWYEQGPLTQISSDINLDSLKLDEKVQGVIVPWTGEVYEPLENNPVGLSFISNVLKFGKKVIVELDPTASAYWFEKSERQDSDFDAYYIWRSGSITGTDSNPEPPNNWISPNNISAWKYSDTRRAFYYSPFNKPHLNFRHQPVVKEFSKVINRFLAANVSGVRLRNAAFLLVDPNFENEVINTNSDPSLTLTQYGFFKPTKTENLPDLGAVLREWRRVIRNKTLDGPLMVAEELGKVGSYKVNDSLIVDMPLLSHVFSKPTLSVNETVHNLNYTFKISGIQWPLWEAKTTAFPKDVSNILTYLLPGAPLVNASEPVDGALLKLRESPSIMRGIFQIYGLRNSTVLGFIRATPGSPGILVLANPSNEDIVANVPEEIPFLKNLQEVTVRYFSSNYNQTNFKDIGVKRASSAIPLSPKSALVLEYVPKTNDE